MIKGSTQNNNKSATIKSDAIPDHEFYILRLYAAGQTEKSLAAFVNLKKICKEHLDSKYRIEVVDLLENPQLAKEIKY